MRSKLSARSFLAVFSLWLTGAAAVLAQAPGAENLQILPQVFSLDEQNSTDLYVQNVTNAEISVGVEFFTQSGVLACVDGLGCPVASFDIPPFGTLQFPRPPRPFVGSATVFCTGNCIATASWSFNIAADQSFEVGVVPHLFSRRSGIWGSPVPPIADGSAYGFAIYNIGSGESSCVALYYDSSGLEAAREEISIRANGQITLFARGVGPGFSGTTILTCDQEGIATGIIQDTVSGFPTNLNYAPLAANQSP